MTWRLIEPIVAALVCGAVWHLTGAPAAEVVVYAVGVAQGVAMTRIGDWWRERG